MSNIKNLKERKAIKIKEQEQDILNQSTKLYKLQINAINGIVDTDWFKVIKDFWILQEKQAISLLQDVRLSDMQEFWRIQAKANMATKFLSFLNNLEH